MRETFIVVQYRCYFILIFSLYFRTQSGTIFLSTASSCAFKMKEPASHLGGWSTLMRQSRGNLREGEHPILTMVSYTSKPLFIFAFHIAIHDIQILSPLIFSMRACVCMVTMAHCTSLTYFDEITFFHQYLINCDLQEKDLTTEDEEGQRRVWTPSEMGRSRPRLPMVLWRGSLTPRCRPATPGSPTT